MGFYTIYPRDIQSVCFKKGRESWISGSRKHTGVSLQRGGEGPIREEEGWGRCFLRNRALILYCEYGSTSLLAARQLGKEGYEVYTVIGGAKAMQEYFSN